MFTQILLIIVFTVFALSPIEPFSTTFNFCEQHFHPACFVSDDGTYNWLFGSRGRPHSAVLTPGQNSW